MKSLRENIFTMRSSGLHCPDELINIIQYPLVCIVDISSPIIPSLSNQICDQLSYLISVPFKSKPLS